MRIFLLPISTRRTLLYCEKHHPSISTSAPPTKPTILDRVINKTNETWATWERAPSGWKKSLTSYGNTVLRRIPYQEWGLKTVPGLSEKRRKAMLERGEKVQVVFPELYLRAEKINGILEELARRGDVHRKRLIWSFVGMPITAPFALIPIIPNIPFFYLAFRAYSHWKAFAGSKTLNFLLSKSLLTPQPTPSLDVAYTAGLMYPTRAISRESPSPTPEQVKSVARLIEQQTNDGTEDVMVLQRWNGKLIAEQFGLPEMEVEIERAVEQVEKAIKSEEELREEKREIEKATGTTVEELKNKAGVTVTEEEKVTTDVKDEEKERKAKIEEKRQ